MYLTQSLHRSVQQRPDAIYSIFGSRALTNAEVTDRVSRLAGGLRGLGVGKDDRVALLALNSDSYLQVLLAVAWADAVVVPVNIRWSVKEIAYSLVDSGVEVLFIDDAFLPMLPALREECPALGEVVYCGEADAPAGTVSFDELATRSKPIPDALRGGDALAGIFYTGGTTGFPKGVMLSHRSLLVSAFGSIASGSVTVGGQVLCAAPLFHLAALWQWLSTSLTGGTHIVVPAFEPDDGAGHDRETPGEQRAAGAHHDPDAGGPPRTATSTTCPASQQLVYGASSISPALLERSRRMLPGTRFVQGYGMTETAAGHLAAQRRRSRRPDPDPQCRPGRSRTPSSGSSTKTATRCPRHRRRDHRPRRARHGGLLEQARGDRGRAA